MADTRLILHVKGTDAETQELPKEDVKTAVAEGRLSYSQLIWSAPDHQWKQVRDLPELLPPGESLILHVKGTESQTRELPRQAVKNAIARGEITHSQLIWSAADSSWKAVREIPDLLPGETLILHVKGTESQTRELPKPAIRAAIQRGEITQTQLIWSPLDTAWKPVSEMPDLQPGESLILHVKGTSSDTSEMPKKAIRTAIKEGKITHSQLIWSAADHEWKQVRDLPELLPSQKLAPAPGRRDQLPVLDTAATVPQVPVARVSAAPEATPKVRVAVQAPPKVTIPAAQPKIAQPTVAAAQPAAASAQPTVAAAQPAVAAVQPAVKAVQPKIGQPSVAAAGQTPVARVAQAAAPSAEERAAMAAGPKVAQAPRAAAAKPAASHAPEDNLAHKVEEHDDGFHPVKWLCIIVGALVVVVVMINYVLVNRPLQNELSQTRYADVFTYAHYGGYFQPNAIVIYIPASDKLTAQNITDYMVALAHSTPRNPITGDFFDRVALSARWSGTAQYSFAGSAWKALGDMQQDSADDRKLAILSSGSDSGGNPLLGESTLDESAQEQRREAAWKEFVATFVK